MKKILDILFIKGIIVDNKLFRNLYYSSENSSFAGFDEQILLENKKYDNYKIIKDLISNIGEYHKEYKAFIELLDKKYFIRILEDNDNKIYDILMYLINNEVEYIKYDRIFFAEKIQLPDSLKNLNKCIIFVNEHVNIVKNEGLFSKYLGYEDWDYKNKCLNMMDSSTNDDIINDFNKNDFEKNYEFITNSGNSIKLLISFKYLDGYYYINEIKKENE